MKRILLRLTCVVTAMTSVSCGGGGGGSSSPPPPVNRAPIASDQAVATNPDISLSGAFSASDADGDALTFAVVNQPASGTLALSGNGNQDFQYTPNAGFLGADSFTFTASDSSSTSAAATVTVNVNAKPVAAGISFSTSEIVAYNGSVSATDAEGDAVTFAVSTSPAKGVLSAFDAATGSFTYTPDTAQDGLDSFAVTASDAFQTSAETAVNVEIFKWTGTQQFGTTLVDSATTLGLHGTTDGGLVFSGATAAQISSTPLIGKRDAWLRKIDRRGNEVWTRQFGDTNTNNGRIAVPDPDGSGTFVIVQQSEIGAVTVYKFDNDGNELLRAPIDFQGVALLGTAAYWGNVDNNGDLYILSWVTVWAVGANNINFIRSLGSFAQVSRYSADGSQLLWSYCDTTDNAASFAFTPARIAANGDGLLLSYVVSDFDPITQIALSSDLVVTRLDSNGNVVFRTVVAGIRIDGTPANMVSGSIVEDPQGILYVSGSTNAELVSGAATGDDDVFLLRLDADGNLQ